MNKQRLFWVIIILVIINLFSIGAHWLKSPSDNLDKEEFKMEMRSRMLKKKLNLTDEQMTVLDQKRKEHFKAVRKIKQQEKELKKELINIAFDDTTDSLAIDQIKEKISKIAVQKEQLKIDHFKTVIKNFNPEQKEQFKEMTLKFLQHNRRHQKRNRH